MGIVAYILVALDLYARDLLGCMSTPFLGWARWLTRPRPCGHRIGQWVSHNPAGRYCTQCHEWLGPT